VSESRPASPDVQIIIDGQPYTLRFSMCAHVTLQDYYDDATFEEVAARLQTKLKARDVVAFSWAGMRTHHPDLTWDDALHLVDKYGMQAMVGAVVRAFTAAMPENEGGAGDPGGPLSATRSTASSKTEQPSA
jgi:hypothetical protein